MKRPIKLGIKVRFKMIKESFGQEFFVPLIHDRIGKVITIFPEVGAYRVIVEENGKTIYYVIFRGQIKSVFRQKNGFKVPPDLTLSEWKAQSVDYIGLCLTDPKNLGLSTFKMSEKIFQAITDNFSEN